jgi:hypothetical protein
MELRDATLMLLTESAAHPELAALAQSAYDQLLTGDRVDYRLLDELIGQASGTGVLRDIRRRYSPVAFDAIFTPILTEIDRGKPVPSRPRPAQQDDPLTAAVWPPR